MQVCLGATYAWAVFVAPLRAITGLSQGGVQLPFSVFYFTFPAVMAFSGYFLRRLGTRGSAMVGGVLFGGGWIVASLGHIHFGFTVFGIGVLAAMGVGLAYVVPLAVCVRWFPKHQGLVTGVAVAGFGGGGAAIGQLAGFLQHARGATPFECFAMFGTAFLVLVTVAGYGMRTPADPAGPGTDSVPPRAVVRHRAFRVLYGAMIAGLAAGFAVNANLRELLPVPSMEMGIHLVSLFAVANALGRLAWGAAFDRHTTSSILRANLFAQAIVLLAAPILITTVAGCTALALLAGFNYGGVLVLYASSVSRLWGAVNVGAVYGVLFSANIIASPAPVVVGLLYDASGTFLAGVLALAFLLLGGAILVSRHRTALDTPLSSLISATVPTAR
jgi:OFA family oxalate/formate antiporter-like MFS transporter